MAKTVYVSKTGNDSNDGLTVATAKLTIAGANAIAVATDTVSIGIGTWTETGQLLSISNVLYTGAGMFLTTIVGLPYLGATRTINVSDLRLNLNANMTAPFGYGTSNLTMNRMYIDGTGVSNLNVYDHFFQAPSVGITHAVNNCIFNCVPYGTSIVRGNVGGTIKFYNCVIANRSGSPYYMFFYSDTGITGTFGLKNCIFYNNIGTKFLVATYVSNIVAENCSFYGSTTSVGGAITLTQINCLTSNPLFIDPAGGDFRLQATSPCIGKGTSNLP